MEVQNRDMFPTQATCELYGVLAPLMANPIVDDKFRHHEQLATKAKRAYHVRGSIGMSLVVLSSIFTVAEALIIPATPLARQLGIVFILLGGLGFAIQLHLIGTKKKQIWLLNRFATERLRDIRFQAYALAAKCGSADALTNAVNSFCATQVAKLEMDLNAGAAAMLLFSPARSIVEIKPSAIEGDAGIEAAARDAFRSLRIQYQRQFAASEIHAIGSRQRIGTAAADMFYLLGAALMVASLASSLLFPGATTGAAWINFLAISAFVVGLSQSLMDNASLAETSKARYEEYLRALDDCDAELTTGQATLPEIVHRIEHIVLEELAQFCQSASRISYRL